MTAWSVVVGGSGAIGRVTAARLVREGHDVLLVGRDEGRLGEVADDLGVAACPADVTAGDAGERIVSAVGEGQVRMLAYLASAPLGGHILEVDHGTITASVDVKVNGLLRIVRALLERFTDDARVVAVAGNLGFDPVPGASTAGIANAAQANLVRQLNRALAPRGVTCHVVAPGPVDTDRFRTIARGEAERRGVDIEEVVREAAEQAPLGRLVRPEDVAWAVARLADPEAAAVAGGALILDGGRRTAIP